MELIGQIVGLIPLAAEKSEEGGSFLVSPGLGLMLWTLVLFLFTMWVLSKLAFPKIQEALDKRAKVIAESIEAAERQRRESDELLEEYRGRLAEAREQADDIMARARKAAETAEAEATTAGKEIESVARQPEMKDELQSIRWLGFALTEAVAFYTFIFGLIAFFLS